MKMTLQFSKMHVCERLAQTGVWEAIDSANQTVSGPEIRCEDCGHEFRLTWEKWECISEKSRQTAEGVLAQA